MKMIVGDSTMFQDLKATTGLFFELVGDQSFGVGNDRARPTVAVERIELAPPDYKSVQHPTA